MSSTRLPSLNQLAARMNSTSVSGSGKDKSGSSDEKDNATSSAGTSPTDNPQAAPNRPRLAAFALRTTSSLSVNSTGSGDSMAVNVGSDVGTPSVASDTVAAVPFPSAATPPASASSTTTTSKDDSSPSPASSTKPSGRYKNIPSLDAITARLTRSRSLLSIDGSSDPPAPSMREVEDPKTPGLMTKIPIPEHPLQHEWTIFFDTKMKYPYTPAPGAGPTTGLLDGPPVPVDTVEYEAGLTVIGNFKTVETFCRYFNWLKPPSHLPKNSNYHLFKKGIKPMWEDPANQDGGKWVITMKNNPSLLDRCWSYLSMALVGQEVEEDMDEICGAVVSVRGKVDRIQVWTRSKSDIERLNGIGKKLVGLLDVSEADGIGLEFQYNTEDRPPPNKFISFSTLPGTALPGGRFHTPVSAVPPAAMSAIRGERPEGQGQGTGTSGGTSLGGGTPGGGGGGVGFGSFGMGQIGGGGAGWRKKV